MLKRIRIGTKIVVRQFYDLQNLHQNDIVIW